MERKGVGQGVISTFMGESVMGSKMKEPFLKKTHYLVLSLLGQPLVLFIILTLVEDPSSLADKVIAASLYGLFIIALYAITMIYITFIQKP